MRQTAYFEDGFYGETLPSDQAVSNARLFHKIEELLKTHKSLHLMILSNGTRTHAQSSTTSSPIANRFRSALASKRNWETNGDIPAIPYIISDSLSCDNNVEPPQGIVNTFLDFIEKSKGNDAVYSLGCRKSICNSKCCEQKNACKNHRIRTKEDRSKNLCDVLRNHGRIISATVFKGGVGIFNSVGIIFAWLSLISIAKATKKLTSILAKALEWVSALSIFVSLSLFTIDQFWGILSSYWWVPLITLLCFVPISLGNIYRKFSFINDIKEVYSNGSYSEPFLFISDEKKHKIFSRCLATVIEKTIRAYSKVDVPCIWIGSCNIRTESVLQMFSPLNCPEWGLTCICQLARNTSKFTNYGWNRNFFIDYYSKVKDIVFTKPIRLYDDQFLRTDFFDNQSILFDYAMVHSNDREYALGYALQRIREDDPQKLKWATCSIYIGETSEVEIEDVFPIGNTLYIISFCGDSPAVIKKFYRLFNQIRDYADKNLFSNSSCCIRVLVFQLTTTEFSADMRIAATIEVSELSESNMESAFFILLPIIFHRLKNDVIANKFWDLLDSSAKRKFYLYWSEIIYSKDQRIPSPEDANSGAGIEDTMARELALPGSGISSVPQNKGGKRRKNE